jgi:hypothetical protein
MKARPSASRIVACVVTCGVAVMAVIAACIDEPPAILVDNYPFDSAFLEATCTDGETRTISGKDCPFCSAATATALCVGTTYGECTCAPSVAPVCESGCCQDDATDYLPLGCTGKVVMLDPSEGQCDAENGYLVCNGNCYASFSCDIPPGFHVVTPGADAGPPKDGGKPTEAGSHEGGDAGHSDAAADSGADAGEGGDAHPTDAPPG